MRGQVYLDLRRVLHYRNNHILTTFGIIILITTFFLNSKWKDDWFCLTFWAFKLVKVVD